MCLDICRSVITSNLAAMLRRSKKSLKRLADDASDSSLAIHHSESERITDNNASLESTVFGGENRITEQLENYEVVTSGFKKKKMVECRLKTARPNAPQPVWTDDDPSVDTELSRKISKMPAKWAQLPFQRSDSGEEDSDSAAAAGDDVDDDDDDDILVDSSTGNCLASASQLIHLPDAQLQFHKCRDVNADRPAKGKLRSVEFHKSAQILLTAGMDQTLRLFQVDGTNNPCIQSVFFESFPIYTAHFSQNGNEVILGSRHSAFYCYDMISGKLINVPRIKGLDGCAMKRFEVSPDGRYLAFLGRYGSIHLLTAQSKEWIGSLKMNGDVEALAFSTDGDKLFSHGAGGDVYVWDMQRRTCCHKFVDDGCGTRGISLTVSSGNQYLAAGSDNGVVNVYDISSCLQNKYPQPLKAFPNLTTACTSLRFNSTNEILAVASNMQEKAVKLAHMRTLTVFSNFPDRSDNVRIPFCLDWSVHSGYLTIGTHSGRALLYRLKHYAAY